MNFQKVGIPVYKRQFITEIGSCDLRGQNVPYCHWQTGKPGKLVVKFSLSSKGREPKVPEQEKVDISDQEGTENLLFFRLFIPFGLSNKMENACLYRLSWIFTQSTESNARLFQKHHYRHTHTNNVLPAIRASLSQINMTHKINHHSGETQASNMEDVNSLCI